MKPYTNLENKESGLDAFDKSRFIMAFLTILAISD